MCDVRSAWRELTAAGLVEPDREEEKAIQLCREISIRESIVNETDISTEAASRNGAWQRGNSATDRHDQGDRVETCRVGRSGGSVYSMMQTGERKGKRQDGRVDEEKK